MGSDHIREASRHPRAYCVTGEGEGVVSHAVGWVSTKRCKNAGAWGGLSRAELTPQNPKPCLCRQRTAGPVASARNVGARVSGTPIKHPVSQWGASTCFAAKMIPSFPGNLAFDNLAFDNFTIISREDAKSLSARPKCLNGNVFLKTQNSERTERKRAFSGRVIRNAHSRFGLTDNQNQSIGAS